MFPYARGQDSRAFINMPQTCIERSGGERARLCKRFGAEVRVG